MNKRTIKSFVKQFIATVKGDEVEAQAEKTFRRAQASLKSHIPALEGELISFEDAVTTAKENVDKSLINYGKSENFDSSAYITSLISAENDLTKAEKNKADHLKKINLLKKKLEILETDVEVTE